MIQNFETLIFLIMACWVGEDKTKSHYVAIDKRYIYRSA